MKELKEALCENYSIKAVEIIRIEYGLWEENYKVIAEDKVYFAKRFWRKSRLEDRYSEMISGITLGQKLRKVDIPAPLHIYDNDGNILSSYQGNTYQVNEWIEGITYRPGNIPKEVAYSMGKLLGKLHKILNPNYGIEEVQQFNVTEAIESKNALLKQFENLSLEGKVDIINTLKYHIDILSEMEEQANRNEKIISRKGRVYNSYWIEQLIFDESHKVKALIDWTDGAGGEGYLINDIDTAFFISAFDIDGIISFSKGYQSENKLSELEWKSVVEYTCTRHLSTNWIYESWIKQYSNRFEHWKVIARKWYEGIGYRFENRRTIEERIIKEVVIQESEGSK